MLGIQYSPELSRLLQATHNAIKRTLELWELCYMWQWPENVQELRRETVGLLEVDKQRAKRLIVQAWQASSEFCDRRYLLELIRRKPDLFLTPELMQLMRKEKHGGIQPLVKELEKAYAEIFLDKPQLMRCGARALLEVLSLC